MVVSIKHACSNYSELTYYYYFLGYGDYKHDYYDDYEQFNPAYSERGYKQYPPFDNYPPHHMERDDYSSLQPPPPGYHGNETRYNYPNQPPPPINTGQTQKPETLIQHGANLIHTNYTPGNSTLHDIYVAGQVHLALISRKRNALGLQHIRIHSPFIRTL